MKISTLPLLRLLLLASPLTAQPQIWNGPITNVTNLTSTSNSDYLAAVTNRTNWSYIAANSAVTSIWAGGISDCIYRSIYGPLPFDCDAQLRPLAAALADRQIEISSPSIVPGLYPGTCSLTTATADGMGPITARQWILPGMLRWVADGGHINKFTIDNGLGHAWLNLQTGIFGEGVSSCPGATFTTEQLAREQALSLLEIQKQFPGIVFGFTDGLSGYAITGLDGAKYPSSPTTLPGLSDLLTAEVNEARAAGAPLSYFILDSSKQPATWSLTYSAPDDGAYADFGRGLAAERLARSLGLKVGVYVTDPPKRPFTDYSAEFADFLQDHIDYLNDYLSLDAKVGSVPDFLSLVWWYGDMPNNVGSESTYGSEFYLVARLIDSFRDRYAPVVSKPPAASPGYTVAMYPTAIQGPTPVPISITITDTAGAADIGIVDVLINRSLDARSACYLAYSRPLNVLYLVGDDGVSLITVPVGKSVSNSQCQVDGWSAPVSAQGVVNISSQVTYRTPGRSTIWIAARSNGDVAGSGWVPAGTWGN